MKVIPITDENITKYGGGYRVVAALFKVTHTTVIRWKNSGKVCLLIDERGNIAGKRKKGEIQMLRGYKPPEVHLYHNGKKIKVEK